MSGHSKWSQIKHQKASSDAKKSKLFGKLSRNIALAVREKGGDPETNSALRFAIDQARTFNMPTDSITRALARGKGGEDANLLSFCYEAYGPGGVGIIIAGVTDNNNRTSNEVKHLLSLYGGKWATPGSVSWSFQHTAEGYTAKEYTEVTLSPEDQEKLQHLVSILDDHDDVSDIYTNDVS